MKNQRRLLLLVLTALLGFGCDKKAESSGGAGDKGSESKDDKKAKKSKDDDDDKPAKKKKGDDKDDKDDKDEKAEKAEKGDKAEKAELVDLDLSPIAGWKGWTIKAPKGAKAMDDMANLRVAGKGCPITDKCPYFDLILSQKKPDLKATKKLQSDGAAQFKDKITFTEESPDALEWTREGDMGKSRNFERVVKVGGKEISCHPFGSVVNESDLTSMKDACKTVAKK